MTTAKRTGRRPGDPEVTKQAILKAARAVFGEQGFDGATMRSIAAKAEVDPALIHHHFGTKQDLFVAAHELAFNPAQLFAAMGSVPYEEIPEMAVRFYLDEVGRPGSPVFSLIRAATTHEAAARMLREFLTSVLLENAHRLSPFPDARLRVTLMVSHMVGLILALRVLQLPDLVEIDTEELVSILTDTAKRYLLDPELRPG